VLSAAAVIRVEDVNLLSAAGPARPGLPSTVLKDNLDWVERETVRSALAQARGVKKDAAEIMGLSQRALSYYLAKHRLEEPPD
jgi:transcriptional regulator with GAF, ATPase, and Fis domain